MVEQELSLGNKFSEKLKEEIRTLRDINSKGRAILKIGVVLAGAFAIRELSQGESAEAAVAGVVAGAGLLILTKDPLAWKIDTREAVLEEAEDR